MVGWSLVNCIALVVITPWSLSLWSDDHGSLNLNLVWMIQQLALGWSCCLLSFVVFWFGSLKGKSIIVNALDLTTLSTCSFSWARRHDHWPIAMLVLLGTSVEQFRLSSWSNVRSTSEWSIASDGAPMELANLANSGAVHHSGYCYEPSRTNPISPRAV